MSRNKNRLARAGADEMVGDNIYVLDYLMISLVMNDEHIGFDLKETPKCKSQPRHVMPYPFC